MNYGNCLSLKSDFENFKSSLIKEGMDEIVCKCFKQVKENIDYLKELNFGENINSLNNESCYIERDLKIKETQHLFKYCIMLLEKENNINPHYKLLFENLLFHFQNIFSLERYEVDNCLRNQLEKSSLSNTSVSSVSSFVPTSQYMPLPDFKELEKQLLFEQNQGKLHYSTKRFGFILLIYCPILINHYFAELIKLKESTKELMSIQNILLNEIACEQVTIDTFQDKIKEIEINTDNFHLLHEVNVISERDRRKRIAKIVLYLTTFLILVIIFRIIF
ncbi:Uncharacterized protein GY17_00000693 [Cryptosporidium hominis]|uniref:t-SNARE coiled-coil homology domain-containing protein n=1 Tax=Cryptosporidium hominis TaxID=237895 RepID=A0ABX5BJL7_CRYHO|nr:hypothetical protein [Cryptosporidium hominis TU502]PPS98354.1 Uncharacterized protein GY17_00000693 [Cryptosporidium hominis]|eukprot:PPS98354.1 Uncharacterized protein GY17_00000693 [Cryptosporidium hominis]